MKILYLHLSVFILTCFGCNYNQEVEGWLIDYELGKDISEVRIYKKNKPENAVFSNKKGEFKFSDISNKHLRCPDVQLIFEKEGYLTLEKTFSPNTHGVKVELKRDLSSFQSIRSEVMDSIKLIESYNRIEEEHIGIDGKKSTTYKRRRWLSTNATEKELLLLIEYPATIIKVAAFEGLYKRKYAKIAHVLLQLSRNSELVYHSAGCVTMVRPIGEFLYYNIMRYDLPELKLPPYPPQDRKIVLPDSIKTLVIKNIVAQREVFPL